MPRDKDLWDFCVQVVDALHEDQPQETRNTLYEKEFTKHQNEKE